MQVIAKISIQDKAGIHPPGSVVELTKREAEKFLERGWAALPIQATAEEK